MTNVVDLPNHQQRLIFHKLDVVCRAQAVEAVRLGVLSSKDLVVL